MTARVRLLVVDDDEVDRTAICRALRRAAVEAEIDQEASGVRGLERALAGSYDGVLLDHGLPDLPCDELVRRMREAGIHTPVLLVTGQVEDQLGAAFAAGATDFLPKADLTPERLASRLRSTLRLGRAEQETRAALAEAQRAVAVRDQVLAIVTHDLRNPLGAARLAVDQLVDPHLGEPERAMLHAAMGRALRRADRLIRDLLEVSRMESGALTLSRRPVAPAELFAACRHDNAVQAASAGNTIEIVVPPGLPRVEVDPDRMVQALDNLVGNAITYAAGTTIQLIASCGADGVRLSVRDRGPGIPAEALPHVFDRFYQASQQRRAGAGLGLAIAHGIVAAHGARLVVDSAVGQGCDFHFALPPADAPSVVAAPPAPPAVTAGASPW